MIVYLFWASVWAVAAVVFALLIGGGIHIADRRRVRAGDIGPVRRRVDLEPMPESVPIPEPAPVPAPGRPMEPAR